MDRPADALLLLSGSHPGRRLPFAKRFLPDVYDELRLATSMRNRCERVCVLARGTMHHTVRTVQKDFAFVDAKVDYGNNSQFLTQVSIPCR